MAALSDYRARVSSHYDETLHEVIERVASAGSLGKLDIGALYFWKRIPQGKWAADLMVLPESTVRAITAKAVVAASDPTATIPNAGRAARAALRPLPGFKTGDALASAAIVAAAPDRMAVYDRRAHKGLKRLGLKLANGSDRYSRYMTLIEDLRAELNSHGFGTRTAREIDLALYWLGR
ncbi:hypothetical protein ACFQFC_35210 [Amorphoplanes digitatis]|uniref:Uncharacterized protein n=1 Tax=Actinoplanes digitatis TaxID=1868 RepID=A0A7W7HVC1_9ACTN|nr:hypothetical protein [Actinoplanes digitatis]MBB4761414.1 hypothetical protein [Actinoplanes digitatis]BFE69840.1 hypothetical protein GCM10020092_031410 [Actinoplanes digitatis]